jgi:hypothetical protein
MTTSLMSPPRAAFSELIGDVEWHDHVSVDASQQNAALDFRNGSEADITTNLPNVRFGSESGRGSA